MSDARPERILVTGANGLLGQHLVPMLVQQGYEVCATGLGPLRFTASGPFQYRELDITDGTRVLDLIMEFRPHQMVHAAAWTQVDQCELNPIGCWTHNVTATRFLLHAAEQVQARFIYVSTDFVFDGTRGPYREQDPPSPVNYYGSSKWAAERAVMAYPGAWSIVRTVLVYGLTASSSRSNLVTWVRQKLEAGETIQVVDDQRRTPTYVKDLADGIGRIISKKATGIFHISGDQECTPYQLALAVAAFCKLDESRIIRVTADTFSQPARRPPVTGFVLDKAKRLLDYRPHRLEDALREMYPPVSS